MARIASASRHHLENLATHIVESVQPSRARIRVSVNALRAAHPQLTDRALAERWAERACRRYAAGGAASALPAIIPGIGTAAQLAIDGGTIAADLGYMLRCMADIVMGVGLIFGQDVKAPFNEEFVHLLGLWCGALSLGKEAAMRVGTKAALRVGTSVAKSQAKRVPQRIGQDLLVSLGVRRVSVSLGRLIPFGVGAVIGGGFNYATMRSFKNATIGHYAESTPARDQSAAPMRGALDPLTA